MKNRYWCFLLIFAMIVSFIPAISVAATGEVAAPTGAIKQGTTYKIVSPARLTTVFGAYEGGNADGKLQDGEDGYCVTDGWYLRSGYSTKTTNDGLIALLMTLDQETTIGGIEIVGHSSTGNDMTDFDVQALVNGEWVEVVSASSNPFASGNRTKMYTFTPVKATHVRILVNKCEGLECKLGEVSLFETVTGNLSKKIDLTGRVTANNPDPKNPVSFAVDGDKSTFLQNFHFPGMVNINLTTADNQPTAVDHFAMYLARGNNYYPTDVTIYIQKTLGGSLEEVGRYSTNWGNNNGLDSLYGVFDQTYMVYAMQVMMTGGVGDAAFVPEIELYQFDREPDPATPTQPESTGSPTQVPTQAPTQAPTETRPPIPEDPDPAYLTYTVTNGEVTITACDTSVRGEITLPYYLGGYPVTTIGDKAFKNCDNLTGVVIPNSVTRINQSAFAACDALVNVTIPSSVKSIGKQAFEYCVELSSIVIPNSVTSIGGYTFMGCSNLVSVTLPEGLTSIGNSMFSHCTNLKNINIPTGVTSIGEFAFYECKNLPNVTFPNSLISIGRSAFIRCLSLTSISIPCGVSTIGDDAFTCCYGLSTVVFSNGVMTIGEGMFKECVSLTSIIYCGTEAQWNAITIGEENEKLIETPRQYHKFSSDCDGMCDLCSGTRIPSAHKYTSVCDASCNVCGETRTPKEHKYSHDCDSSCNFCGAYRKPGDHKYTNSCDTICNTCGAERTITHSYEDVVTKATLSLNGKIEHKCSVCGDMSADNLVIYCPTSFTLSNTSYTYNGQAKKPTVTVKDSAGETLVNGTDYTVTYPSGCTNPGTYKVTVTLKGNYSGTKTLTFKIESNLEITTQPKTQKVKAGSTAKFTVKATGEGLKYQWQSSSNGKTWKNCSSSSAKKATFSFTSKTSHSSNYYRCKVTDSAGNVLYTDAVRLYVLSVTTQPKAQKVEAGEKVKYTVSATGAGKTYQWQVSSDGKTWKNCSSSSAKKATFTFSGKTSHSGNYYRCRIKDSGGNTVYTDAVRLYVLGITEQPVSKTVTKGKTAKFTVEATGASKVYQWQVSTDGGKTWKNCSSTSAKKATFSFTAKTTHNGNYYRCRIKDSGGNTVYTNKVKLTVK